MRKISFTQLCNAETFGKFGKGHGEEIKAVFEHNFRSRYGDGHDLSVVHNHVGFNIVVVKEL